MNPLTTVKTYDNATAISPYQPWEVQKICRWIIFQAPCADKSFKWCLSHDSHIHMKFYWHWELLFVSNASIYGPVTYFFAWNHDFLRVVNIIYAIFAKMWTFHHTDSCVSWEKEKNNSLSDDLVKLFYYQCLFGAIEVKLASETCPLLQLKYTAILHL